MNNIVTEDLFNRYLSLTEEALKIVKKSEQKDGADEIIDMVSRYLSDAKYFFSKGDRVRAFAAVNYAHGWLDCGARLRIFKVNDSRLFTVDNKS